MKSVLLHPHTEKQLKNFIKHPSHALLIVGPVGSGKFTLAKEVAINLLGIVSGDKLANYPYFIHVKRPKDKQNIAIEQIRALIKQLKLKTPGRRDIRRVIIIEDAEDLNDEGSNAMLKILEEPSAETIFILTTSSEHNLLPTIVSRTQQLNVKAISASQAQSYYQDQFAKETVDTAWQLAQGRIGLLTALLTEDSGHLLKQAINESKAFLRQNTYQRLLGIEQLAKDKKRLAAFLDGLSRLLVALYIVAISKNNAAQAQKLLNSRKLVQELQETLEANVAPRLILLKLAVNLVR
ncbi:AAA family ATPase [Candidatus Saccharibacteria bacterium]|nr:AAA family ATPase [Candidatus Saccharibacteria bacterium]